jgi:cobalamin synthase
VPYNSGMSFADQNKVLRVILYSLLFLISFLVFDSITVVITVFFAVVVLGHFLRRAYYKESR